jgi:serine/threonine protein kinase
MGEEKAKLIRENNTTSLYETKIGYRKIYKLAEDEYLNNKYTRMVEILIGLEKNIPEYIPEIYNIIHTENNITIDMEKIEGRTMKEVILDRDNLTDMQIYEIIKSLLLAVVNLHNNGCCHNDLNPTNIIVTKDNTVKLIDFDSMDEYMTRLDYIDIKMHIVRLMFRDIPLVSSIDYTFNCVKDYKGRTLKLDKDLEFYPDKVLSHLDLITKK